MFLTQVRLLSTALKKRIISRLLPNKDSTAIMNHSYEDAVNFINSLQSNRAYIENVTNKGILPHSDTYSTTIAETQKYLLRTGITLEHLDKLSIIHVSGTKGKGSTSAFCESILRQYRFKTGFYSSPHLVSICERIKLNGKSISKEKFTEYFFKVYHQLMEKRDNPKDMPTYFRFLTILAFNVFLTEKVDVAVLEVGIGGEYDCTNVVRNTPIVGITSLGLDHIKMLGDTIEKIAWQKGGIMKNKSKAFTVDQPNSAMKILKERSIERQSTLQVVPKFDDYIWPDNKAPILGINGSVQKINASLAIQLAHNWIKNCSSSSEIPANNLIIPEKTKIGLENCQWPARSQILKTEMATYYIDGAHTRDSIEVCTEWFKSTTSTNQNNYKVMIFNATGQRNSGELLEILSKLPLDHVLFVPNIASSKLLADQKNLTVSEDQQLKQCENHKNIWLKLQANNLNNQKVVVHPCLLEAIESLPKNKKCDILVTGSLHLAGAVLSLLNPNL